MNKTLLNCCINVIFYIVLLFYIGITTYIFKCDIKLAFIVYILLTLMIFNLTYNKWDMTN